MKGAHERDKIGKSNLKINLTSVFLLFFLVFFLGGGGVGGTEDGLASQSGEIENLIFTSYFGSWNKLRLDWQLWPESHVPTAREIFQTGERLLPWTSIPFGRSNNISVWLILSIEHYLSIRMHYFSCILSISFIWIAAFPCVVLIIFFLILQMNVSFKLFTSIWRFVTSSRTEESKRSNNKQVMWSLLLPSSPQSWKMFQRRLKTTQHKRQYPLPPTEGPVGDSFEWLRCTILVAQYLPVRFLNQSCSFKDLSSVTSKECGKEAW